MAVTVTAESAALREWIDSLAGQSFFFTDEIPGWDASLRSTLARIAADPEHPLERVSRGFYCKRWHQDWPQDYQIDFVDPHLGSIHFAGQGAGPANWQALNLVGWTAQHPWRNDFCSLARPPRSPWGHTRFVQRSNGRRSELTWAEVTLLEALRNFDQSDIGWDHAAAMIASGDYLGRLRYDAEVESERLSWAAAGELRQPFAFHERTADLCSFMPPVDSFAAWSERASLRGSASPSLPQNERRLSFA